MSGDAFIKRILPHLQVFKTGGKVKIPSEYNNWKAFSAFWRRVCHPVGGLEESQSAGPETWWRHEVVVRAVIRRVSRVASVSCCVLGGNKEKGCCYLTQASRIVWVDKRESDTVHHKNDFIILIVIRGQISICHFLQYITMIRLSYTLFLYTFKSFCTCFWDWHSWHSLVRWSKKKKKKERKKGTRLLLSTVSNTVKTRHGTVAVCVAADETPPDRVMGSPPLKPLTCLVRAAKYVWSNSPKHSPK